jgi:BirA family biotin operon repressor/biotin-[acetyl-CoA-carboxylase] ligase
LSKLDLSIIRKNVPSNLVDIDIFDEIDSTNEECKRSLSSKMLSVKIANRQTKGRGRRGKNWSSPSLGNIYMSIAQKNVETDFPLSLSAGVISYDAISSITQNDKLGLKWPNDIIFDNKKVGGILVEQEILGKDILSITGIGININLQDKEAWWGDLSELGVEIKREAIINKIILGFLNFKNDNAVMKKKWESACMHLQKKIKIIQDGHIIDEGVFKGINSDGSLLLDSKNNSKTYHFGEISIMGIY